MGDRVAVDCAIGMGWQVHSRDYVLHEYPSGGGKQSDVFGLDDGFEPPLDLPSALSTVINAPPWAKQSSLSGTIAGVRHDRE